MPLQDPGINVAYAFPNMGKDIKMLEEAMIKEIEKVKLNLIDEKEFTKLKNQVENDIVNSNTRLASRANSLARYYTYFNDTQKINTELERYMAVTREDIKRVANDYFSANNRVVLYYLPKNQK
jgi:zinc protease